MSIETRMDEFEKVSNKEQPQDVSNRMAEFEAVDKYQKKLSKEKYSTLPYGIKRYKTCPQCDEIMEIHEIKGANVIYKCKTCHQNMVTTAK